MSCSNTVYLQCCSNPSRVILDCNPTVDGSPFSSFTVGNIYLSNDQIQGNVCWEAISSYGGSLTNYQAPNYTTYLGGDCDDCVYDNGGNCISADTVFSAATLERCGQPEITIMVDIPSGTTTGVTFVVSGQCYSLLNFETGTTGDEYYPQYDGCALCESFFPFQYSFSGCCEYVNDLSNQTPIFFNLNSAPTGLTVGQSVFVETESYTGCAVNIVYDSSYPLDLYSATTIYNDCDDCFTGFTGSCFVNAYWENCCDSSQISLITNISSAFQVGQTIFFSGQCYFYTGLISYDTPVGNTDSVTAPEDFYIDCAECISDHPCSTPTPTPTPTSSVSVTPTVTPSISISPTVTPSISTTVGLTPTVTSSLSVTPTPSITPTPSTSPVPLDCDRLTNPNFKEFSTCGGPCTGLNCQAPTTFRFYPQECIPGWSTTAPDNNIEIWKSGFGGYTAYNGDYFAEINASSLAFQALYQNFTVQPGETYQIQFAHMGRSGFPNQMRLAVSGDTSGIQFVGSSAYTATVGIWTFNTINYTFTDPDTEYNLMFSATTATNGGNFIDAVNVVCPTNFVGEGGDLDYTFTLTGTCFLGYDVPNSGAVVITPFGGIEPYNIQCISGQDLVTQTGITANQEVTFSGLSGDTYTFLLSDALGGTNHELFINVNVDGCMEAVLTDVVDTTCGQDNGSFEFSADTTSLPVIIDLYQNGSLFQSGSYDTLPVYFDSLPQGSYSATTQDFGGAWTSTTEVTISSSYELDYELVVTNNANCGGGNSGAITISGLTGVSYTYLWSNGSTGDTITGLSASTYSVTVTDTSGCTLTKSAVVNNDSDFDLVYALANQTSCLQSDGIVTVYISGGTPDYVYSGSTGQIFSGSSTSHTFTGVPTGDFYFTVTDANLCQVESSITVISEGGIVAVSASVIPTNCNSYGNLEIFVEGTGSPYIYSYTGVTNPLIQETYTTSSNSHTFFNLTAGTYNYSVQTNSSCSFSGTVEVNTSPPFGMAVAVTGSTCGLPNGSVTIEVSSGYTGVIDYILSDGQQVLDTALTSYTFNNLSEGVYTATTVDSNGCSIFQEFFITTSSALEFFVNTTDCTSGDNGSASITIYLGNPPFTYLWSDGSTGTTISGLSGGTYSVQVTEASGCTKTKFFNIECGANDVVSYQVFEVSSNDFVTTVGTKRGMLEMLNECYLDLTSGYTNCVLNSAVYNCECYLTGETTTGGTFVSGDTVAFYTGYTLTDVPSDQLWADTIEGILSGITEIQSTTIDLINNTIECVSFCDGSFDPFRNGWINIKLRIDFDITCAQLTPPTPTPTPSVSITPTITPTQTITPTVTPTMSVTPSNTPTVTPTSTVTPSITISQSITPTVTPSVTPSVTPTVSPTQTVIPTATPTPTVTPSISITPSITPSISITPTVTPTQTVTPSITPTPSPAELGAFLFIEPMSGATNLGNYMTNEGVYFFGFSNGIAPSNAQLYFQADMETYVSYSGWSSGEFPAVIRATVPQTSGGLDGEGAPIFAYNFVTTKITTAISSSQSWYTWFIPVSLTNNLFQTEISLTTTPTGTNPIIMNSSIYDTTYVSTGGTLPAGTYRVYTTFPDSQFQITNVGSIYFRGETVAP